ncbi:hypothetical protein KPL74_01780 [Bacillus sp. NP157]|nr:hypothetical protein KPL74_01780 [Bacillus sp. NP157]
MMRHGFFHRNGLSIVVLLMMLATWSAQCVTGFAAHNDELIEHGRPSIAFAPYLVSGDFWSATLENWESEFLQMGVYVLLTVWLRQKGSAESRPMDEEDEKAADTPEHLQPDACLRSGVNRWLYANSLSLAFLFLFLLCFCGHLLGSWRKSIETAELHHQPVETFGQYAADPSFWFESFQNWQSEFLAVFSLIVLSIFLRQKDSPQSKKVDEPNSRTGT